MYQYLAAGLGLKATKVWTNASGARFCPRRTIACTSAMGGTTIHGCSVGYTYNVTMVPGVLRDVLRDSALGTPNATRDCGVSLDTTRPKLRPWDIDEELVRPF